MKKTRVESFYDLHAEQEWQRLERHRTEFAVTMKAFEEFLPPAPLAILDIGGGPGRYALALSERGYTVTLLDLSSGTLEMARQKSLEMGIPLQKIVQGNALNLSAMPEKSFDAVLLLGPLYHLETLEDKITAVEEAKRVLKPGGILFASFITRYAIFRDGASKYPEVVYKEREIYSKIWQNGVNISTGDRFTDAYFSMPDEVLPLMEGQALKTLALLNAEGIVAGNEAGVNNLSGEQWEYWAELNYQFAKDPALRAAANHLVYIGKM